MISVVLASINQLRCSVSVNLSQHCYL